MAGDGGGWERSRRARLDQLLYRAMMFVRRPFRLALAICVFMLGGCRVSPAPAQTVTLALLGDVMLGRRIQPTDQSFAYLESHLAAADLAMANLESPLTSAPPATDSGYVLCALPERAHVLKEAGFDLLSLANNHHLDCGEEGSIETRSALEQAGIEAIGPGMEPTYRDVNGFALAFLAFDATAELDLEAATRAIREARERGAVVVVSVHWGAEYQSGTSARQEEIAARFAGAGAALVWGHHPHVLQPARWVGKTLVLYSLGNALFDQQGLAAVRRSALALVTIDPEGVQRLEAIPFVIDVGQSRITTPGPEDTRLIMDFFGSALRRPTGDDSPTTARSASPAWPCEARGGCAC